jgi:hypothetical protein
MNSKSLLFQTLAYLTLPIILFCAGFLKWYVSIVMIGATLWSVYSIYKINVSVQDSWKLRPWQVIGSMLVSLGSCFFLGISGYCSQSSDWIVKNPILNELVYNQWPLLIDNSNASEEVKAICGEDKVAFVYYLFFYLPASLFGKMFGSFAIARLFLFFWSAYGLDLLFRWLLRSVSEISVLNRRNTFLVVAAFVAWGGMDIIGQVMRVLVLWIQDIPNRPTSLIDLWCMPYFTYYASHFTSIFWCFNQSIPIWLVMISILSFRNCQSIGFFYCLSLLYSPWATIGLLPIIAVIVITRLYKSGWKSILTMISFENVIYPLLILIVVGTYYSSNSSPLTETGFFWHFIDVDVFFIKYVFFIIIEIGAYVWLMRREIKTNAVLFASVCLLLIIPFYKMTRANDFIMRVSIPALFVIFTYWLKWSVANFDKHRKIIITLLILSSFTALQYVHNTTKDTLLNHGPIVYKENELISAGNDPIVARFCEDQFFAHDYEDTFFWKYLVK